MKFSLFYLGLAVLSELASAGPLARRQSASQAADVGYATLAGGTTGGAGGPTTTVTTLAGLQAAVTGNNPAIVIISGTITGSAVVNIGSNKTVLGKNSSAGLVGIGLRVNGNNNVIIRNLKISKVLGDIGDAIGVQYANHIWIDHNDLSSDMTHSKDYYDGLLDITHGCDYVTVSFNYFHDHYKGTLVGHSDNNAGEDRGHLTITYKHNFFKNINSRTPSYRFGTGHIYNNYFESCGDGIHTRQGAQLLVQNNVFQTVKKPLFSSDGGYATAQGNDFGGVANTAPAGSITGVPYSFTLGSTATTKAYVVANAGNKLSF